MAPKTIQPAGCAGCCQLRAPSGVPPGADAGAKRHTPDAIPAARSARSPRLLPVRAQRGPRPRGGSTAPLSPPRAPRPQDPTRPGERRRVSRSGGERKRANRYVFKLTTAFSVCLPRLLAKRPSQKTEKMEERKKRDKMLSEVRQRRGSVNHCQIKHLQRPSIFRGASAVNHTARPRPELLLLILRHAAPATPAPQRHAAEVPPRAAASAVRPGSREACLGRLAWRGQSQCRPGGVPNACERGSRTTEARLARPGGHHCRHHCRHHCHRRRPTAGPSDRLAGRQHTAPPGTAALRDGLPCDAQAFGQAGYSSCVWLRHCEHRAKHHEFVLNLCFKMHMA